MSSVEQERPKRTSISRFSYIWSALRSMRFLPEEQTIVEMVNEQLFPSIVERLEEDGADIGNRLRFIQTLEHPSIPEEHQSQYQKVADELRKRWGLVDHDCYFRSGILQIYKRSMPSDLD